MAISMTGYGREKCEINGYEVSVEMVEYIGRDKTLIFKFKGQNNTYKAIIPSDNEVEPGQTIKIDFKRFFIFDEEGNRLV